MYYETSYSNMINEERELWEDLERNSCRLLDILYSWDENNHMLAKYINVLFGFRSATQDHDYIIGIRDKVYNSTQGYVVDKFYLQKKIKDYLGNIDSTLDYLHKFLNQLKTENNKKLYEFDREKEKFADRINNMRNEVMHEGVPSLKFDTDWRHTTSQCHADIAGSTTVHTTIWVRFNDDEKNDWHDCGVLISNTYLDTKKLIGAITDKLITQISVRK